MEPVPTTTFAAAGAGALAALREVVAALRGDDPLAPATVVVPGNVIGIHVRRALGRAPGVANVEVVTLRRLAERWAGTAVPIAPDGAWDEAVRVALVADPGPFRSVQDHPATTARVATALTRLRPAGPGERARFASHGARGRHLVDLVRSVERSVGRWADGDDVLRAAAAAVPASGPPVVLWCHRSGAPAADALVAAVAASGRGHLLLGLVGEDGPDAPVRRLAASLEPAPPAPVVVPAVPDRLVVAPDAEAEARLAVQRVVAAAETGTPLHRIAIVPAGGPAARLRLVERLEAAGIPWSGPSPTPLASSIAGRTLLGLLGLVGGRWVLADVLAVLAGAPVRREVGRPVLVPAARWGRLARDANVVAGSAQLVDRPRLLAERLRRRGRHEEAGEAEAFRAFAAELVDVLRPPATTWSALGCWATGLLARYLGPVDDPAATGSWPEREVESYRRVLEAVAGLAALDQVERGAGADPGPAQLAAAVGAALDRPGPRAGRIGTGVLVATAAEVQGAELDLLLLTGLVEGAVPSRRGDDPLVPDGEALGLPGALTRAERRAEERAALLGAIASAARVIASTHRAEHQADRRPSRWFLGWAGVLDGRSAEVALSTDELLEPADRPWLDVVPSFAATLARPVAADPQERALASLTAWAAAAPVDGHPVVAASAGLGRAITAVRARRSARFTRYDGLVPGIVLPQPVSASSLETFLQCPQRWLLAGELGVGPRSEPEDELGLANLSRGDLAHKALRRLLDDGGVGRQPDEPWSSEDQQLVQDTVRAAVADLVAEGRMGLGTVAQLRVDELVAVLERNLHLDDRERAEGRWVPAHAELSFGDTTPVELHTPEGRRVRFHGRIDRIDRADPTDGSGSGAVRVVDYKAGRATRIVRAGRSGPEVAKNLQLAVYELAVRTLLPDAPDVTAAWWLLESERGEVLIPNALDRTQLGTVVDAIATAFEDGAFPAVPGDERKLTWANCQWCAFDRICPSDRAQALQRKLGDPALAALTGPAAEDVG